MFMLHDMSQSRCAYGILYFLSINNVIHSRKCVVVFQLPNLSISIADKIIYLQWEIEEYIFVVHRKVVTCNVYFLYFFIKHLTKKKKIKLLQIKQTYKMCLHHGVHSREHHIMKKPMNHLSINLLVEMPIQQKYVVCYQYSQFIKMFSITN